MRIIAILTTMLALIAFPQTGQAKDILASVDGIKAYYEEGVTCARRTWVLYDAETPEHFFNLEAVQKLSILVKARLQEDCTRRKNDKFQIRAMHEGHFLDWLLSEGDEAKVYLSSSDPRHPIFKALYQNPYHERREIEQNGKPEGAHSEAPPQSVIDNYNEFPYHKDQVARFGNGGINPAARYTDMQKYLIGKTYLYYPYHDGEKAYGIRKKADQDNERLPSFGFTVGETGVTVFNGVKTENVTYQYTQTRQGAKASCFVTALSDSSECHILLRLDERDKYFQSHFLSHILPYKRNDGKITFVNVTSGYVKETSAEIAIAELGVAAEIAEVAALQDELDKKQGKPKKDIKLGDPVAPWLVGWYQHIYAGQYGPKVSVPLRDIYTDLSGTMDSLLRETIFLAHHQAVGFSCSGTADNKRKIFSFLDTARLDSTNNLLSQSSLFLQFLGQATEVRETYFEAYSNLANFHLIKVYWNYKVHPGDFSFRRTLSSREDFYRKALQASNQLIANEGCNSPTMQKFEKNLLDMAYTPEDAQL